MDSMDYFSLPRKQLQALCKKNGIPANSTNLVMAEALTALIKNFNGDEGEQHSNEKEACKQESASIITDANCVIISDDDEVSSPVPKRKNQRSKPKKSQPQSDGGEAAETGEETVDDDGGSEEENKVKSGKIPARKAVVDHATPAAKKTPHTRARKTRGAALTEDVVNHESDEAADKAPKGRSRKKVSYENADPSSMDEDNDNGVKQTRSRAAKTPAATRASSRTAAKTTATRASSRTAAAKTPAPMPSATATEPPAEDVPHKTPCTRGRRRATIKEVIATDEDDAVKKPDGKTRRRNAAVRELKGCMEASTQGEVQQEKVANRRQTRGGKSRICYDSDELQSQKEDEGMQSEHDEKNKKHCEIREIATEKEKESECNEETQEGFVKEVQEQVVLCTEEDSKTSVESIEQCQIENLDTDLCEEVVLELDNKRESTVEMQDLADFEAPAKEVEVCTQNQTSADFEAEIPHDKEVEKQTIADIEAGASPVEEYHTERDTENNTVADFEVEVSHDEVEVCTENQTSADFEAEIPHHKEVEKQTVADIEAEASPVEELRTERHTENKTIADFEVEVSHDEVECNTGVLSENMILESYNDEEEQNEDTEEAKDELKYANDQKESRLDEVKSEFMSNKNGVFSENIADANLPTESDREEVEQNEDSEEVEDELKCTNDQHEASQEFLEQQNEVLSEYIADANLPTESDNNEDEDSEEVGDELRCTNDQNEASQEVLERQDDGNSELISKEKEEIEEEYPCDPKEVSKENEMVRSEDEAKSEAEISETIKTEEDELSVKADADIQDLEELNAELVSEIFNSKSHQEIKSEIHKNVHEQITEDEDEGEEEEESDKMDEASFDPESMDGENQEMNVKKSDCSTEEFKVEGSNDENEEANVGPSEYLTDYSSQIQLRKEESSYCIELIEKEKEEYQNEECLQVDRAKTCLVEQNTLSKVTADNSDIVEAVVSQKQHRKPLTDLNNRRSSSGFKTLKSFSLRRLRKEVQKLEAQKKDQKMKKAENHHDAENIENSDSQISCLQQSAC